MLLFAFALLFLLVPARSEAHRCHRPNVLTEYQTSDVVFRGRVTAVEDAVVTFVVRSQWKGIQEGSTLQVIWPIPTRRHRRRSCDPHLPSVGDERLVLARLGSEGRYELQRNSSTGTVRRFLRVRLDRARDEAE